MRCRIACRFSLAPLSLPGRFTMSADPRVAACARDNGAIAVFASEAARISSPKPGITFSHSHIVQEPRERGLGRMMVVTPKAAAEPRIEHLSFADFPERLAPGDVLVINDTRVIPARLFAKPKPGMSRPIEILLTRRVT